jgi:inositol transport system permease protein
MAGFAILEPRFFTQLNLFNIMRQVSIVGLLAVGMTFVILTAGIDLSIGSLLALCGLAAAAVAKGGFQERFSVGAGAEAVGYGWEFALLTAILVGLAGGLLQGFSITRLKVPPFVVTLGGMSAFRGAALLLAGGGPISGFPPDYTWWGQGRIGPVPVPVIIFVAFAVLAHVVLRYSRYGRQVYAVGGNPEAARRTGIPRDAVIVSVYVLSGLAAGVAAVLTAGRTASGSPNFGNLAELDAIAAVIIGGAAFAGGRGNVGNALIGAFMIGIIRNVLNLQNVDAFYQMIVIGLVILIAVEADVIRGRVEERFRVRRGEQLA